MSQELSYRPESRICELHKHNTFRGGSFAVVES